MNRKLSGNWKSVIVAVAGLLLITPSVTFAQSGSHEESQRERWQKVEEIFQAMQVRPGAVVADVGAGDGFFTARLSAAVGAEGRVVAVDVGANPLRRLQSRVRDQGLTNVEVVEGAVDDPRLPAAAIDAALIVNAYHEMTEYHAMLSKIRAALKPGGRLVIVEPISRSRRESARDEQTRSHEIAAAFVREEARAAGFAEVALHDPFTTRPHGNDEEWMLVLSPQAATPSSSSSSSREGNVDAAEVFSSRSDGWKAPELRIGVDEFKRLDGAGGVLILDVRDPGSYRQGHLPGAILMTPEELSTPEGVAKLKGEKRLIVAYCS